MVSRKNRSKTYTQLRNWKTIILLCVIFSILLTTHTFFDNIDVSANGHKRPHSDEVETTHTQAVPDELPKDRIEEELKAFDAFLIFIGLIIGALSAGAGIGINRLHKKRKKVVEIKDEDYIGSKEVWKSIPKRILLSSSRKDCCIASSVIDTGMMAPVNFLRNYREKIVKKSTQGQKSLNIAEKIYYSIAPPIAKLDAKYEKFRLITRTFWSGPIVSILLCGMLLFNSGRKEFIRLQKTDPHLTLKILTIGISASIFAISWIIWNCYLIISLFNSGILANIWQPAAGMLIGIVSLLILRTLYSDIPTLSDSSKH